MENLDHETQFRQLLLQLEPHPLPQTHWLGLAETLANFG